MPAVYGVKAPLIVDFQKMPAGSKAPTGEIMNTRFYVVNYDFALQKSRAQSDSRSRGPRRNGESARMHSCL